jgi:ribonucleoside-diphosphate reductase alpha chain
MHVSITIDPKAEKELEIFAHLGKAGDLASADLEAMCRLSSLILRMNGGLDLIVDQLTGIGSSLAVKDGSTKCLGHSLAEALSRYLQAIERAGSHKDLLVQGVTKDE